MSNETLFFIFGIALAVSAVLISLVGLKVKSFPGKHFPLVVLWFAILVGAATTFAVLHAQDEEKAKASEFQQAGREIEERPDRRPRTNRRRPKRAAPRQSPKRRPRDREGRSQLAADPTELAFDKTSLASKPGKVTIDFTNPATLEHDVAIEDAEGTELAVSALIGKGKTSVSADLSPGTYHFFCTVPGHREAGMEGTLTVR